MSKNFGRGGIDKKKPAGRNRISAGGHETRALTLIAADIIEAVFMRGITVSLSIKPP